LNENKKEETETSIIILNYNAGNLLLDCVDSIIKSSTDNYEIIFQNISR